MNSEVSQRGMLECVSDDGWGKDQASTDITHCLFIAFACTHVSMDSLQADYRRSTSLAYSRVRQSNIVEGLV